MPTIARPLEKDCAQIHESFYAQKGRDLLEDH